VKSTGILTVLLALSFLSTVPAYPAGDAPSPKKQEVSAPFEGDPGGRRMAQGREEFRRGAFGEAMASYEAALGLFAKEANRDKQCEALIMLSQVSHFTGQYRKALEILDKGLSIAKERNDRRQIAAVLGSIGNAYIGLGNFEAALNNLREGLAIAGESGSSDVIASIQNNLGNLYSARGDNANARTAYRESALMAEKAGNLPLAVSASVNGATSAMRGGNYADAGSLLDRAATLIPKTDDSYVKAYSLIGAGLIYSDLRRNLPDQAEALLLQAYTVFKESLAVAQRIDDLRTVSYAYGYLGKLSEEERRFQEALEFTRMAVFAAQQVNSAEALYRWYWQSGRILARMGATDEAIVAYRQAILELQALRGELSSCYASPESTYQKTASVVCSELVDLLLRRASGLRKGESAEAYLMEARETLEVLKVYELREYFKDDCVDASRVVVKKLDTISEKTVVLYPIFLPDRVELLVSFSGRLKSITLPVSVDVFTREAREFRRTLVKRTTWEFLPHAQKLYDWMIRPFEDDLNAVKADTLVFVPDGPLRSVPMAALHDGNRFLVDRYRIAVTPGLNLTDPGPVDREQAKMLSMGVTQAVQGFPGLPYVSDEMKFIKELYGGEQLLNAQFKLANLEQSLKKQPFSMVHVASHGQFGTTPGDTFLLAFDERLTMDRFGEYIGLFKFREEPLDLLTLSACETAAGDDRAALGLAGVAVRAGARSALATLWHVNDPATYELIVEFYRQLRIPSTTRAAALQAAQRKLQGDLRYDHPGYWAPFLLINNWL
jgi:CHAT domain-containing protein